MATMNISLPDKMKRWVESQSETGRYGNTSDYVRDLIRKDQEADAIRREIQQAVDEGLASGSVPYSRKGMMKQLKAAVR